MYGYVTGKIIVRMYPPSSIRWEKGRRSPSFIIPVFVNLQRGRRDRFFFLAVIFYHDRGGGRRSPFKRLYPFGELDRERDGGGEGGTRGIVTRTAELPFSGLTLSISVP